MPDDSPPWVTGKEFRSEKAVLLGELCLLQLDIESACQSIRIWNDMKGRLTDTTTLSDDFFIHLSLFRDAIIQFTECFRDWKIHGFSKETVYAGHPDSIKEIEWLETLRDTYAAHRFSPLRQVLIVPRIDKSGPELKVIDIEATGLIYRGEFDENNKLVPLFNVAKLAIKYRIEKLTKEVLAEAMALTESEILSLPNADLSPVTRDDVRMGRASFHKKKSAPPGTPTPARPRRGKR